MKRIKFLSICCIAVLLLIACSNKITVKGEDGTEYESYQECCAAQDFQAAHQFLAKMQNTEKGREELPEAKEFVFKQEALYLMSIGDEDAKKRIIYLLKEEGGNDEHINLLMDIALDNKDEEFIKSLSNQYKSNISSSVLRKIVECLYIKKEDNSNFDYLSTLLKRYNCSELLLDAASEKGEEETVLSLANQFSETMSLDVFKKVMDFLSSHNSKHFQKVFSALSSRLDNKNENFLRYAIEKKQIEAVQEIIKSNISKYDDETIISLASINNNKISIMLLEKLSSYENDIPKRPSSGTFIQETCYALENECDEYADKVKKYNEECIDLLNIAIKAKNRFLANRVIAKMKPNLSYNRIENSVQKTVKEKKWYGDVSSVEKWDKMIISGTTNRDDIKAAQNTLNEAVRGGAFK